MKTKLSKMFYLLVLLVFDRTFDFTLISWSQEHRKLL